MKYDVLQAGNQNMITGYGDGFVAVNTQRYTSSVIVMPNRAVAQWSVRDFAALEHADFKALLDFEPEIVLLGTGERQQFPPPQVMRMFAEARVGFEAMDSRAACRTYNILMSEGREVLAALIVS
jgi:uncharacterized protein